ncbi:hypothetical protein [Flavobacterium sp. HNIBRBA15423]|uniref:hypothetical protein n=1 Tax=Flavobacterium sp. HNIBRBA15423 TaxID=3458683 RepID=UPI00404472D9
MKKTIIYIKSIFFKLWNFRKIRQAKSYEQQIKAGILNKELEKIHLIKEAHRLIPKKTKKGVSKYIPMSYTTKIKIKTMILAEFGLKMKVLGIEITDNLEFI